MRYIVSVIKVCINAASPYRCSAGALATVVVVWDHHSCRGSMLLKNGAAKGLSTVPADVCLPCQSFLNKSANFSFYRVLGAAVPEPSTLLKQSSSRCCKI